MLYDALNRVLAITTPPQRIVSLVPSLTEYLFAIGEGARLVGVTDFCEEPAAQVAYLPKVRGTKNPNRDIILQLQPDMVLAAKEENRLRDVEALEAAGIAVYVTDICSVASAREQLATLAHLLDAVPGAAPLLDDLESALEVARQQRQHQPAQRVLAFIWCDPWMAAGADTYTNDVLQWCGGDNLALRFAGRYPRATLEEFLQGDPQVILLPDEPYRFGEPDLERFAFFSQVAAVQEQRVHLCDGKLLTWYGPRTAQALRELSTMLAPPA
jgi:ABC-type Fe3+-hydroxamate transport system substrate-binding protein